MFSQKVRPVKIREILLKFRSSNTKENLGNLEESLRKVA